MYMRSSCPRAAFLDFIPRLLSGSIIQRAAINGSNRFTTRFSVISTISLTAQLSSLRMSFPNLVIFEWNTRWWAPGDLRLQFLVVRFGCLVLNHSIDETFSCKHTGIGRLCSSSKLGVGFHHRCGSRESRDVDRVGRRWWVSNGIPSKSESTHGIKSIEYDDKGRHVIGRHDKSLSTSWGVIPALLR